MPKRITHVVWPVTTCALYTCLLIRILAWNLSPSQPSLADHTWRRLGIDIGKGADGGGGDGSMASWESSFIITFFVCGLIIIMTLLILLILSLGWHKCLIYYFYLPSLIILCLITPAYLRSILLVHNLFVPDIYTILLVTWNFTALGMMSIFGLYAPGPLCLQQFYLIHNSAILSVLVMSALPGWAPWLLLIFLVIWDMFAVLAPIGPLNLIISMAERVGVVEMPGLVYSTAISDAAGRRPDEIADTSKQQRQRPAVGQQQDIDESSRTKSRVDPEHSDDPASAREDTHNGTKALDDHASKELDELGGRQRPVNDDDQILRENDNEIDQSEESANFEQLGVSIGLGDFIFYSLLIGLTSKGRDRADFYTVLATLVAVLFGLVLTLIILNLSKRALPALPISIALGLTTAALTGEFANSFSNRLASRLIFI